MLRPLCRRDDRRPPPSSPPLSSPNHPQGGRSSLRSGFGEQTLAGKKSQPSFGFGSSVRDAASRQYLSRDQTKAMQGNNSQGAIYRAPTSMGRQADSTYASAPAVGMGAGKRPPMHRTDGNPGPGHYRQTSVAYGPQASSKVPTAPRIAFAAATRDDALKVFQEDADKAYYGLGSPGPCAYPVAPVDKLSTKQTGARVPFSTANRFEDNATRWARQVPGAGHYPVPTALGKQALSTRVSAGTARIGKGTRDAATKATMGVMGEHSPGPGARGGLATSMGRQVASTKVSRPSMSFARSERRTVDVNDTPGPGSYYA